MVCADIQAWRREGYYWFHLVQVVSQTRDRQPEPGYDSCEDDKSPPVEQLHLSVLHFSDYSFQRNASRAART